MPESWSSPFQVQYDVYLTGRESQSWNCLEFTQIKSHTYTNPCDCVSSSSHILYVLYYLQYNNFFYSRYLHKLAYLYNTISKLNGPFSIKLNQPTVAHLCTFLQTCISLLAHRSDQLSQACPYPEPTVLPPCAFRNQVVEAVVTVAISIFPFKGNFSYRDTGATLLETVPLSDSEASRLPVPPPPRGSRCS